MTEQDLKNAFPKALPDRRTWRCPDEMQLAAYVDHRLIGRDHSRLERHLAECGYCLGQVAALTGLHDAPLPADIPVSVIARARELAPGKAAAPWKPAWSWVAVAATTCLALLATFSVRQPQTGVVPHQESMRRAPDRAIAPTLIFPREGAAVPRGVIEFRWSPAGHALYYEVSVLSADGDLVWEQRADGTEIRLPAGIRLAPSQNYYVSVSATLSDGRSLKSPVVAFQVTSQ